MLKGQQSQGKTTNVHLIHGLQSGCGTPWLEEAPSPLQCEEGEHHTHSLPPPGDTQWPITGS